MLHVIAGGMKVSQSESSHPGQDPEGFRRGEKLIRYGEAHNEFAHKIWDQSVQYFFCKSPETDRLIEDRRRSECSGTWPKVNQTQNECTWTGDISISHNIYIYIYTGFSAWRARPRPSRCGGESVVNDTRTGGKHIPPDDKAFLNFLHKKFVNLEQKVWLKIVF